MTSAHPEWVWHDGQWVHWDNATVHVTAHALHYGSSVFEGIRTYETKNGPAVFRLPEHIVRFFDSAKLPQLNLQSPKRWRRVWRHPTCLSQAVGPSPPSYSLEPSSTD